MTLSISFDEHTPQTLSAQRILAFAAALAIHLAAFLLLIMPTGPSAPSDQPLEEVLLTSGMTMISIGKAVVPPPPPPPKAAPVVQEKPVPADPKAKHLEVVTTEAHEPDSSLDQELVATHEIPPIEVPEIEEPDPSLEQATVALFDAMANGAEPNPDSLPTEQLSFRTTHPPRFPSKSRLAGESGWVILRVLVDAEGFPIDFVIDPRTTATDALAQAAIDAVQWWEFRPAIKNGQTVRAWMEVPIGFFNSRRPAPPAPAPVATTVGNES